MRWKLHPRIDDRPKDPCRWAENWEGLLEPKSIEIVLRVPEVQIGRIAKSFPHDRYQSVLHIVIIVG